MRLSVEHFVELNCFVSIPYFVSHTFMLSWVCKPHTVTAVLLVYFFHSNIVSTFHLLCKISIYLSVGLVIDAFVG